MNRNEKILILGSGGLVGSSIVRELTQQGYENLLTPKRSDLDLSKQSSVIDYFMKNRPTYVFNAAAKVGGIQANNVYRADFIFQNLQIQNNTFEAAFKSGVQNFLFLGSSCIYPKLCDQPIKEEYLLTKGLEPTNEPYAIAKIAGLKTAESFNKQYGLNYFSVMPTNLYGVNDNFHPENSHVIPALIRRIFEVIDNNKDEFEVWGTGEPMREFLYVDDLARACIFLMKSKEKLPHWINVGTGEDIKIKDLAQAIAKVAGFKGKITFNSDYPDGTPRKLLDVSKIHNLGWKHHVSLEEGLQKTIEYYRGSSKVRSV